jgi:hypothetical protein
LNVGKYAPEPLRSDRAAVGLTKSYVAHGRQDWPSSANCRIVNTFSGEDAKMTAKFFCLSAGAALFAGLFGFNATASAMQVPAPINRDASDVLRVHGTHGIRQHCHNEWSTSVGWHLHRRHCDLPQYNPDWRDPRHWHWRLYEEARKRRWQRHYRTYRSHDH